MVIGDPLQYIAPHNHSSSLFQTKKKAAEFSSCTSTSDCQLVGLCGSAPDLIKVALFLCYLGGQRCQQHCALSSRWLLPVDKILKWDAVRVALSPDVHSLQDACVAQLHHHPLLAEAQRLPVVVGLDAADKVRLAHHHLGQQVHQGVLRTDSWPSKHMEEASRI